MLEQHGRERGSDLDLAYMPYHEGKVNHNAPPVRGSFSVRVDKRKQAQQAQQQAPYYTSDEDDDVSDDPAWMNAPPGSLQPALPPSLLKKTSSGYSVTDTRSTSPVSPGTEASSAEEDDEGPPAAAAKQHHHKTRKSLPDEDEDEDYFPPLMPAQVASPPPSVQSSDRGTKKLSVTTEKTLRKCKSMPVDHGASPTPEKPVVQLRQQRNSRGNSEIKRLSFEKKAGPDFATTAPVSAPVFSEPTSPRATSPQSFQPRHSAFSQRPTTPASAAVGGSSTHGFRESMMRYRPSDLKPQELTMAMLSRDSLAPSNDMFNSSRSNDPFGSSRSNDPFGSSRSNDPFGSSRGSEMLGSSRTSVMNFGPRVTEEGLSEFLRAVKAGNLQSLRACLQDRHTDVTQRDPVHGQTALHIAVRFGQLHAMQLLCQKKTRALLIDAVDNRQNTPLHLAAAKSRRMTKFLLERGADASRVNARNQTPLAVHVITAKRDEPLIAEMLLQHKTNPNGPLGNSTILHKAVDLKFYEIAYRLVRHGARLDVKDAQGRMVFEKVDRKVLRQLFSKIAFPPVWVPNVDRRSCMSCQRHFSKLGVGVRRHHCRHCGRLVCGRCSHVAVESDAFPESFAGHMDRTPADERSTLKRVCNTCCSVFEERAKKAKSPESKRKWSNQFMERVVGASWDEIDRKHSSSNASRKSSLA